jgi:hypothetical protein
MLPSHVTRAQIEGAKRAMLLPLSQLPPPKTMRRSLQNAQYSSIGLFLARQQVQPAGQTLWFIALIVAESRGSCSVLTRRLKVIKRLHIVVGIIRVIHLRVEIKRFIFLRASLMLPVA